MNNWLTEIWKVEVSAGRNRAEESKFFPYFLPDRKIPSILTEKLARSSEISTGLLYQLLKQFCGQVSVTGIRKKNDDGFSCVFFFFRNFCGSSQSGTGRDAYKNSFS